MKTKKHPTKTVYCNFDGTAHRLINDKSKATTFNLVDAEHMVKSYGEKAKIIELSLQSFSRFIIQCETESNADFNY
ncbi:MAG: hypothetical protein WCH21_12640 [Bacteroidota bacterium]